MSIPTHETMQPQYFQPQMPVRSPKKRKPWLLIAVAVGALLIGAGAGSAAGASKIPDTVTVEKVVEKKVTVEVPVTPAVCTEALNLAGEVISSAGRAIGYSTDSLEAAGRLDADTIRANTAKTRTETETLKGLAPKYLVSRESCLASASK